MFELGNDEVAFLAGLNPIHEILDAVAAQAEAVDALWKHPGKEQRVVANVLADLALAVEGWSWAIDGIGFEQHFANIGERAPGGIADLEQLLRVAELGEQVGNVSGQLRIAQTNFFG